jgi:hypothetical protein
VLWAKFENTKIVAATMQKCPTVGLLGPCLALLFPTDSVVQGKSIPNLTRSRRAEETFLSLFSAPHSNQFYL